MFVVVRTLRGAALLVAAILLGAADPPPPAPVIPHAETLFGMTFDDPYHWMENGGPAFDHWITAAGSYTRNMLDRIPGHAAVLRELRKLDDGETQVSSTVFVNGLYFALKRRPEDAAAKLYVKGADRAAESVLIDPARFDANGTRGGIDYWSVSPNARYVAYGVSLGGAEIGTLRVKEVATGTDLPEQIDRTRAARPSWMDDASFLYSRLPPPAPGAGQELLGGRVYLHNVGTDPTQDVAVFGPGLAAALDLPRGFYFRGLADPTSSMVVAEYDPGLTASARAVFTAQKSGLRSGSAFQKVAGLEDDIRGVVLHGDQIYLRTVHDAPRQRILRTSAIAPDLAHAAVVVPEGSGTISSFVPASDALYVQLREEGIGRVLRVPWNGTPQQVALPFDGATAALTANAATAGFVLRLQNWTHSPVVIAYDPEADVFTNTGIAPASRVSFDDIEWIEVRAPTPDSQFVPLSIVARRGAPRDGRHPVLMYVYGAYGVAVDPNFSPMRRAWFDRGGIYVVVHVRGSGGFGDEWHRAGKLENKPKSISDFVAAAEYLVKNYWANPDSIGALGASAGGVVVGGAISDRPDLFAAALVQVGLLNPLRLGQLPIGPSNVGEFGSTATEDGVRMLYAIDAYQRIRDGVEYPGVMISTALNDTRVLPWMPAKFAARLQAADSGPKPVLLRVEEAGGHSVGTREEAEQDVADTYTFLLWQEGVPGFQPEQ